MFHCLFGHRSRTSHEAAFLFLFVLGVFFSYRPLISFTQSKIKPACCSLVEVACGTFKNPDMAPNISPWLARSSWEGFHTYLGRHSRDTFLSEQDVNERKTQKIPGLWSSHTHAHAVPLSVHRCWCALHDQIVCKSVQKVTARARVREDPGASGAARTGRTRKFMKANGERHGGGGRGRVPHLHTTDSNTFPRVTLGVGAPQSAHMRPRPLGSVGPRSPRCPPPPTLADMCLSPRRE